MTWLIYMPYFDSDNKGNREAQSESIKWFSELEHDGLPDTQFKLDMTHGTSEDRLPFLKSIWGQYDLIYIESTKHPTRRQLYDLIACPELLCTQNYESNIVLNDGAVFKFPAHKIAIKTVAHNEPFDVKKECIFKTQNYGTFLLRYCTEADDYAHVSDLGILKISRKYQLNHPKFTALYDKGHEYNSVERLHDMLFFNVYHGMFTTLSTLCVWHRHKELAYRSPLVHYRRNNEITEYVTVDEMKKMIGL